MRARARNSYGTLNASSDRIHRKSSAYHKIGRQSILKQSTFRKRKMSAYKLFVGIFDRNNFRENGIAIDKLNIKVGKIFAKLKLPFEGKKESL